MFFLLDVHAPGLAEPIRIAPDDLVSRGERYMRLPLQFDTMPDDPVITVRGDGFGLIAPFLPTVDGARVVISVILETLPDEILAEYGAVFRARRPGDDGDVVGFLVLAP